jgi:hypothetical protein
MMSCCAWLMRSWSPAPTLAWCSATLKRCDAVCVGLSAHQALTGRQSTHRAHGLTINCCAVFHRQVPLAQKFLIQKARLAGVPVMVAGQLMEGMAVSPRPSRPEITDVVNAVYDGADAVVLMQVCEGWEPGLRRIVCAGHRPEAWRRFDSTCLPVACLSCRAGDVVRSVCGGVCLYHSPHHR